MEHNIGMPLKLNEILINDRAKTKKIYAENLLHNYIINELILCNYVQINHKLNNNI